MTPAPEIPGYRVRGVLGTGGFATVYRSWQYAVGREVAIKVDNRVLLDERDRRRFVREVTAAGRLSGHPHVIDVYDAGTLADGRPYMVMELCPAGSLNDALRPRDPECWNGLVEISGSVSASTVPCTRPHVWQTFAIAILPASVHTFNRNVVRRSPAVDAVCSMRVLLASRRGAARQIPRVAWQVEVMPPDEAAFDSGARAYRCVAHQAGGSDPSTSEFGPQADRGGRDQHAHGGGPGNGKNG